MQLEIEGGRWIQFQPPADPNRLIAWQAAREINEIAEQALVIPYYSFLSSSQVLKQLEADGWRCRWCGNRNHPHNPVTVRHILLVGLNRTGRHDQSNLQTLCATCARIWDLRDYARLALVSPFERGPVLQALRELNSRCGPVKSGLLADFIGKSERTARHYLHRLERVGWLERPFGPRSGWMVIQ